MTTTDHRIMGACGHAADAADQWHASRATDIVLCASRLLGELSPIVEHLAPGARGHGAARGVYRQAAAILDAALKIGKQADPLGPEVAAARLADARREAAAVQTSAIVL
jgi:hypothetical protein